MIPYSGDRLINDNAMYSIPGSRLRQLREIEAERDAFSEIVWAAQALRAAKQENIYYGNELQALCDSLDAAGLPYISPGAASGDKPNI